MAAAQGRMQVLSRQLLAGGPNVSGGAPQTREEWEKMYQFSILNPDEFWAEEAKRFTWFKKFDDRHHRSQLDVRKGPISISWFSGGKTNISYNCLDRWVASQPSTRCLIYEGNTPQEHRTLTYQQTLDEVCRVANWLKKMGLKKGNIISLYMSMGPELIITMQACARIGVVHAVVFGGFSADSLSQRILDSKSKMVVTCSAAKRGAKNVELKGIVDAACAMTEKAGHKVEKVLVWRDPFAPNCAWVPGRDCWWQDEIPQQSYQCAPEWMDAEDRLFLLYTSGSTGQPKGVVHTTGGYMVGAACTMRHAFDAQPGDIYFSTADCGWITGHTYGAYGPLLCGVTSILFGGVPTFPDASRLWQIVEKHKPKILYTAPTLIRSLMQHGDAPVLKHDVSSLRVLASVGEAINPHAWHWFHEVVGKGKCPIVDTYWQTETGSHMLLPQPGAWCTLKPGCASLPFLGVQPVVLDAQGSEIKSSPCEGVLAFRGDWPAMARTLSGDHERFEQTYFSPFPGFYITGDGCRRDEDGYIWITGRTDDVVNVSGHRIGTAEVEAALTEHPACVEAAVIGVDHAIKGQGIYAYVTLAEGTPRDDKLRKELMDIVRRSIGAFAVPEKLHWAPALPKTRSGKIMRRILRKIATGAESEIGDVSTLADPGVVSELIAQRGK